MKYLGIDWGMKKIGLAISEGNIASALTTLQVNSLEDAILKISQIIKKENIDQIILGQPEGKMGKVVQKVAKKLPAPVTLTDETLSSQEARRLMIEGGISQKKRRDDNSQAAALILQNYLDSHTSEASAVSSAESV